MSDRCRTTTEAALSRSQGLDERRRIDQGVFMDIKRFASADLPAHLTDAQRFALWYALYREVHGGADVSISEYVPFSAAIETVDIGAMTMCRMSGTITRSIRTAAHVAAEGRNDYALLLNCGQPVSCLTPELEIDIPTGAGLFVSYDESFTIAGAGNGDGSRWLNLILPRALLENAFAPTGELSAQAIPSTETLSLLFDYIRLLQANRVTSNDLVGHATETVVDLLGLAIGLKGDAVELAGSRGLRTARFRAVLAKIRAGFDRPGISAQSVAAELGLSTRYVHDLLHENGVSFAEHVLELRLQKVHRMLSARRHDMMKITDIVLACGFSDVSYFNRSFRKKYGFKPSALRE
jgi:AraC-like DNA-binding protein